MSVAGGGELRVPWDGRRRGALGRGRAALVSQWSRNTDGQSRGFLAANSEKKNVS